MSGFKSVDSAVITSYSVRFRIGDSRQNCKANKI